MERKTNKKVSENKDIKKFSAVSSVHFNMKGDEKNIALLFFLYTLQGIPLGLSAALPMILQNRGISYKQQAEFSFVTWPFSIKLLWAPLVDCIFSKKIGRRKTWLIPTQYLIGTFMIFLSHHVENWIGEIPNMELLTISFFILNFLAATQDIAVDGWALTMLKKDNIGHSSACNSVGQTAGFFLSYVLFMALESSSFCNMYIRWEPKDEGIITLPGFLSFWGWLFLVTTTVVAIFKKEEEPKDGDKEIIHNTDINTAYKSLKEILSLKSVQTLCLILLTSKVGFSATDSVMSLKLVEAGVPKERLGLLAVPMIPVQIALPLIIAKYTSGPRPLDIYLKAIPYRLMFGFVAALLVWITPILVPDASQGLPILYVVFVLICYIIHQVCVYCMFVSVMAFFAKVSDSSVGGTYMTLLNTLSNLGGNWPSLLALYFVDPLTWKQCVGGTEAVDNSCRNVTEKNLCSSSGGTCQTVLDGFYLEILICAIIGFLWLAWGKKRINYIQNLDDYAWKLSKRRR